LRLANASRTFAGVTHPTGQTAGEDLDNGSTRIPGRLLLVLIVVLAVHVIGGTTSLLLDRPRTLHSFHVIEITSILFSAGASFLLWRGWWRTGRELGLARTSLVESQRTLAMREAERDAWRESANHALAGLGQAIDGQFRAWQLTPTEREIALRLLQGHGHKLIAAETDRSERTVRQHAVMIYQKAGLAGRAELAAFFLQDLRVPDESPRLQPGS
jgi:DNA-binding CsgD family transcriptional regulator